MTQRYLQVEPWWMAIQNALKPTFLMTMAISILGSVVVFGLLCVGGDGNDFLGILQYFVGVVLSLLCFLLGLTGLAHQLHQHMEGQIVPNSAEALRFAWGRMRALMMLPAWGIGLLFAVLMGELLLLSLANIPGLGLIWLSVLAVPLLLLNTVISIVLILALFNIAVRVALSSDDVDSIKMALWTLMRERLPTLLLYNLGGVLVTCIAAIVVLSPLWLGAQMTLSLMDYTAQQALLEIVDAIGFWGSIAHLLGLVMVGLLLAAVISVPGIVITHMTLLAHLEFMDDAGVQEVVMSAEEDAGTQHEADPSAEEDAEKA